MIDNEAQKTNLRQFPDAKARRPEREAKPHKPKKHIVKRTVVVIMPFGSGDTEAERAVEH